jgi:hypothetical protein
MRRECCRRRFGVKGYGRLGVMVEGVNVCDGCVIYGASDSGIWAFGASASRCPSLIWAGGYEVEMGIVENSLSMWL